jgi:hypothetical protein
LLNVATTCLFAWTNILRHSSGLTGAIEITILFSFFEKSQYYWFLELVEPVVPQSSKFLNPFPKFQFRVA